MVVWGRLQSAAEEASQNKEGEQKINVNGVIFS